MRLLPQFGVFNQHDALTYLCQPSSVVKTGLQVCLQIRQKQHTIIATAEIPVLVLGLRATYR